MRGAGALAALVLLAGGCGSGGARAGHDPALADTLKQVIADAYDFTQPSPVERMASLYPDTGRVISTSGGQITTTADSLRRELRTFWERVGQNMRDPRWQWDSVYVERLGPDAAALTGSWRIPHIAPDGNPHVVGGVWTAVFRRVDGRWKIVQEHLSSS